MARRKRGVKPTRKTQGLLRRMASFGLVMVAVKAAVGAAGGFAAKKVAERYF